MKLANDFSGVLNDYFPTSLVLAETAQTIQRNYIQNNRFSTEFFQLLQAIESSSSDLEQQADHVVNLLILTMKAFCSVLERDRSLVKMGKVDPKEKALLLPLPTELQNAFEDFNLVTHNFGIAAVMAAYQSMCPQPNHKVESSGLESPISSN